MVSTHGSSRMGRRSAKMRAPTTIRWVRTGTLNVAWKPLSTAARVRGMSSRATSGSMRSGRPSAIARSIGRLKRIPARSPVASNARLREDPSWSAPQKSGTPFVARAKNTST